MHPEYEKAAEEMAGENVKFVNVDATQSQSLAGQYGVQGYPTIKVWCGSAVDPSMMTDDSFLTGF